MKLAHTTLSEKEIELTAEEVNFLGPDLHLEKCTIRTDCDNDTLTISGMRMVDGVFLQEKALTNFPFERAHLINVKFIGTFVGCDFGDWETSERSSVSGCDFSNAVLDGCRFLNCDMQGIHLPKWPAFTLINPSAARSTVLSRKWPSDIGLVLDIYTDNDPECVAICGNAQVLAESSQVSLDDFREILMTLPGIVIHD